MIVRRDASTQLLFVEILVGNIVLWDLVRVHFPLVRVVRVLNACDRAGFKKISFFRELVNAFRIRLFGA